MGSSYSKQTQATDAPAVPVPDVVFDPPYFDPSTANVLVIETYHSMGGIGLSCALLYSPHMDTGGIAIDGRGRFCEVPEDRWKGMEDVVRDAKEEWAVLGNHSSWSRPQMGSCPVSVYFDLGPSDDAKGLYGIQRTAHTVSTEDLTMSVGGKSIKLPVLSRREILTCKKNDDGTYEETTVDKIPEPITRLESELSKLQAELFPRVSGESVEGDAKAMAGAVKNMSSPVGVEAEMLKGFRRRKTSSWFNW
ncbi:hypothetical protein K438DRAFT_41531 [Mycena galopus ATCC 62051]|nr:hypothetical protein K438DRAFT_41531 [Mycena galopus ATCC 62051]